MYAYGYIFHVSNRDTVLVFESYTDTQVTVADKVYKINLFHHGKYLDAEGVGSEYNVKWNEAPDYPLWQFVTEEDMFLLAGNAPQSVIDKTFFLQNVNTGYFLNINGNETVSNTAQVNVYAKENVQAQRWVIRNTAAGPKIFTKLNENFALNIYAKDNNCTMYDADVSDTDTVLEVIPYSAEENIYRIKMHYHGRYLNVSGVGIGATCYWTTNDTTTSTLWRLIPESEMTFEGSTETDTTPDSPLVKPGRFLAMPAGTYMVGRDGIDISEITIHHTADVVSSIEQIYTSWINSGKAVSSHYCVRDHDIVQFVKECNTAYTNGGEVLDPTDIHRNHRAVTIETCNCAETEDWPVSDASLETLIALVADIARRNNLGTLVVGQNLTWHKKYANTECPGPYLMARLQYIADEANKINNATYIRKHNTNLYLGVNVNNEIVWTDRDGAKGWNKVESDGGYVYYDIDEAAMCLQVAADGVTPILADKDTAPFHVFGVENERGLINLCVASAMSTFTSMASSATAWIAGVMLNSGETAPRVTAENAEEFTESEEDLVYSSLVSSALWDKNVRIKYRFPTSDTIYCLTISETDKFHPSGNGINVEILPLDEEDPKQIWRIHHYGGGLCGLTSFAFPEYSLEMEPFSNAVVANDRSILNTLAFDGTDIKEPYNKMFRNLGISIIPSNDSENGYKIKLSAYDKYLYHHSSSNNAAMIWSNAEPMVWNIEEAKFIIVDGWLKMFLMPEFSEYRAVDIPSEEYRKNDAYKATTNSYSYSFEDMKYWYSGEPHYTKERSENNVYNEADGRKTETLINPNAYRVWMEAGIRPAINFEGEGQALTDGNDRYWMAIGPRVINPDFPSTSTPGDSMYNTGTLDVVVKGKYDILYFVHGVVGDVKAHTWSNGIYQTWKSYPSGVEASAGANYNGVAVAEFITEYDYAYTMNPGFKKNTLGKYELIEIRFYDKS